MKKSINTKPSSRRDFLRKSALGVASAGFVGADLLQNTEHEPQTKPKTEAVVTNQTPSSDADITISSPVLDVVLVRPGRFHLTRKSLDGPRTVSFFADNIDAVLLFPDSDLTDDSRVDIPMGATKSIKIKQQKLVGLDKSYRYVVFSPTKKRYGVGNSEPEMIVP